MSPITNDYLKTIFGKKNISQSDLWDVLHSPDAIEVSMSNWFWYPEVKGRGQYVLTKISGWGRIQKGCLLCLPIHIFLLINSFLTVGWLYFQVGGGVSVFQELRNCNQCCMTSVSRKLHYTLHGLEKEIVDYFIW